ncbi:MAG: hypothetical protein AAGC71_00490 [Pseudomonadota bacterium]
MLIFITASLLVNIVVLIPVCYGLFVDAAWANTVYGPATDARQILLAVYLAIGLLSTGLLVFRDPRLVFGLLAVQVAYKVLTPLTVSAVRHPVVISNLCIAAMHVVTLAVIGRVLTRS